MENVMKKTTIAIATLVAFTGIAGTQVAMAQPKHQEIRFECPNASGGVASERLTNTGTTIFGNGEENIDGTKYLARFASPVNPLDNIPSDLALGSYSHAGADYNPVSGRVDCKFTSAGLFDPFRVSYFIKNGKGGTVLKSSNSTITIQIPFGYASL
jgi:hypothetical protein